MVQSMQQAVWVERVCYSNALSINAYLLKFWYEVKLNLVDVSKPPNEASFYFFNTFIMKGQLCASSNQPDKGHIKMQGDINITVITSEKHHGKIQEVAADLPADVMGEYCGLLVLPCKRWAFCKP